MVHMNEILNVKVIWWSRSWCCTCGTMCASMK